MLAAYPDKSAHAQCTFGFCMRGKTDAASEAPAIKVFAGKTMGKIVPARGPTDFGWDPIFEPDDGNGLTYAQMKKEDKNKISHRFRALKLFADHLESGAM